MARNRRVKPACRRIFTNSSGDRERADRGRQVAVGGVVARDAARPMRGSTRLKYQPVHRSRTTGHVGIANSRIARRPPGSARGAFRRTPRPCSSTLRMPKPIVTASTDASAERNARRVAAHQRDASIERSRAQSSAGRPAASRRRNRRRPPARAGRLTRARAAIARSPVPVHRSSTRSRPVSRSERMARLPPAPIDAGAEQMIEEIVAAGDRVEHARDARQATSRRRSLTELDEARPLCSDRT